MKTPASKYYILLEETEHGPFDLSELKGLVNDQIANSVTPAREDGDSTWMSISEILSNPPQISNDINQSGTHKAKTIYQSLIIGGAFIAIMLLFAIYNQTTQKSLSKIENEMSKFDDSLAKNTDSEEIKALKNEVASLKSEISTLQEKNSLTSAEMKKIKENYEINKKFLSEALNKLLEQYTAKLSELTKTFEEKNNEIEKNLQDISTASKSIVDFKNSVKILDKNYDLLDKDIKAFKVKITETFGKTDAELKSCDERIRIITSSLENIQRQVPKRN